MPPGVVSLHDMQARPIAKAVDQLPIDPGLAIATVRGHHTRRPPGLLADLPPRGRTRQSVPTSGEVANRLRGPGQQPQAPVRRRADCPTRRCGPARSRLRCPQTAPCTRTPRGLPSRPGLALAGDNGVTDPGGTAPGSTRSKVPGPGRGRESSPITWSRSPRSPLLRRENDGSRSAGGATCRGRPTQAWLASDVPVAGVRARPICECDTLIWPMEVFSSAEIT